LDRIVHAAATSSTKTAQHIQNLSKTTKVRCSAQTVLWIDPSQRAGLLPTKQTAEMMTHQQEVFATVLKHESCNVCLHPTIVIPLGILFNKTLQAR